ncbi:hypothetical protein PMAC_001624 [Pneumocystis sp. 'macacae']|nr:hypothetical protein PMAC_001624 [Pneumocystis sp. 'macacae']
MKFKKIKILDKKKEWKKKSLATKNIKKRRKTIICFQNEHLDNQDLQKKRNKIYKKIKYNKKDKEISQDDSVIFYLEEKLKHKKQHKYNKNKKDELDYLLDDLNHMENSKIENFHFTEEFSDFNNSGHFKNKINTNIDCFPGNKENNTCLFKEDTNVFGKKKENPYIAPLENNTSVVQDNILENSKKDDTELILHLRRKIKGLMNRLSESNMLFILNEVENLYNLNPRYFVNLELIILLLTYITSKEMLKDSYLIQYSGFIAALYRIIGIDFGASFLQKLFKTFHEFYSKENLKKNTNDAIVSYSKECINLVSVLSELYSFQVISCTLIYDLIKLFLNEITDLNTELLLKIILNSGNQLRHDDPLSLKDIVIMMRQKISETGVTLNARTKFMVESIDNLKNNKIKDISYNNRIQEDIFRMKKFLGTLSNRNSTRNTEPLRISLHDIESTGENDKWWHIGTLPKKEEKDSIFLIQNSFHEEKKKLLELAQSQRMNTDIRRSIFITIMSGEDFVDAFEKLLKLGLKKVQKLEIPRVLLHCCGNEQNYNPYYAYVALRFCVKIHSIRTAFKFCLWDLFRSMGEKEFQVIGDIGNEDLENVPLRRIVNLGRLYAFLVVKEGLDLTIFKKLNFFHLQYKTRSFIEVFFSTLILETQKEYNSQSAELIQKIFKKLSSYPPLVEGINLKQDKEAFIQGFKKILETLDLLKNI